jgi:hypothetical protein
VRAVFAAGLVISGAAHADDATSVHDGADERPALFRTDDEPMLHLDPVASPSFAGLGATKLVDDRKRIDLGKRTWVELEGTQWKNDLDVPQRGWSATVRVAHDFGPFWVSASASASYTDSRFGRGVDPRRGRGTSIDAGVTIGRSKRLSRWKTAWIALTVGVRRWQGEEGPIDEPKDSGQVMLSIGTTFK